MTNGRWMDAVGSERRVLREVIAQEFMDETGSTWLYDKGEWLVDLLTITEGGLVANALHEAWGTENVRSDVGRLTTARESASGEGGGLPGDNPGSPLVAGQPSPPFPYEQAWVESALGLFSAFWAVWVGTGH